MDLTAKQLKEFLKVMETFLFEHEKGYTAVYNYPNLLTCSFRILSYGNINLDKTSRNEYLEKMFSKISLN